MNADRPLGDSIIIADTSARMAAKGVHERCFATIETDLNFESVWIAPPGSL